ncbi:MAG TPA: trigger factor [Acetobacteraceae bacterium]|nr:trigger factor [Acetobacteraceae bacterium]
MQVTETLSDGLKRAFTVVVPAAEIESKRATKLSELGKNLRLPGFRPGKVPAALVRQRYGTAALSEAVQESVEEATRQVILDRGLRPAEQPAVSLVSEVDPAATEAKDVELKLELELLPEIAIPELSGIALTRHKAQPAAEAIEKTLGTLAGRQGELVAVEEDRGAEKGEVLTVDFVGKVDDVAFPGGTGSDMDVEIAGAGFIPGFSEQMEGMKPGETRTINVTFPEEYHAAELAGKAATFEITAKALRKQVPAELNDEFATKLGFESLDKLREAISDQIQREYDQLSRLRIKRELLDALAGLADFPAPEGLVEAEFQGIWQRVEADRAAGRLDDEDKSKDEETLKREYRAIALRRVRLGLLLSEIGRVNNIQVTPEELTRALRTEASRYPGHEAEFIEFFRRNPRSIEGLRGPIFEDKVVDYILELAKIEEHQVSPEELSAVPESPAAEAA